MGWFSRKIKVREETFIADRLHVACTESLNVHRELLNKANARPSEIELMIYSAYLEVHAMTLAGINQSIRNRYVEAAYRHIDEMCPGGGNMVQERFATYATAFSQDVADGKPQLAPRMLGSALENILGASDESVVLSRMALAFSLKSLVASTVPFFKELKVRS